MPLPKPNEVLGKKEKKKGLPSPFEINAKNSPRDLTTDNLNREKTSMMKLESKRAPALSVPENKTYNKTKKTETKKKEPEKSQFRKIVEGVGQALADIPEVVPSVLSGGLTERLNRQLGFETLEEQQARAKRPGGIAGEVIATALPVGRGIQLATKGARGLSALARGAGVGAATGAASQIPLEIREEVAGINDQTLGQRAIDVGIAGAIGGGVGAAAPAIGAGIKTIGNKGKELLVNPIIDQTMRQSNAMEGAVRETAKGKWQGPFTAGEPVPSPEADRYFFNEQNNFQTLALPEPRQRGNVNQAVTDDVIATPYTFALPAPSTKLPKKGKVYGDAAAPIDGGFVPRQQQATNNTPKKTNKKIVRLADMEAAPASQVIDVPATRVEEVPVNVPKVEDVPTPPKKPVQQTNERGFINTLKESEKVPETLKERLSGAYKSLPNSVVVDRANARVAKNPDEAYEFVTRAKVLTAEHVTTAHRLIDEYTKAGQLERAVEVVEKVAEMGTRAGQAIQAFSLYERLSPEGVLLYAQRVANKVNDKLPITADRVTVTPQTAAQLTELAGTVQKMTGVKGAANDVMNILDRAKSGGQLTKEESDLLQQFVKDAKQFVKVTEPKQRTPKPPKQPTDKRVKDKVVTFLDAQEQAAKERLRAQGIRISSTPIDIYADYAIVGAAKMAKGVVKFADWSEQMIKEYGEQIRPYIYELYDKAVDVFNQTNKGMSKQKLSQVERITENVLKNGRATEEEAEAIREIARKVAGLSGEAKNTASQDLQFILNQLDRPSFLQKVSSFQTIAQLFNPKTLLTRNPLGNELFYRLERMNKYIATPIDIGRSLVTGGPRQVTFRTNNQGEYWKNWMIGAKAGWRGVNPEGISTQYDIQSPAFTSKLNPLHYMEKALGASLKSFDYASYKRAVNQTVGEMATLRAINEGLKGEARKAAIDKYIREADENVSKIADEYGKYITFQDNNPISVGLQKFKRGLNFGKEWGIGDMVIKYPKTPGALLMRALEYSPAGFLRSAYILAGPIFKREPNPREVTLALSRAIVGTSGLSGLGFFLADKGIITGAASKDRDVRDLQKSAGQGQYQVNLSALYRWVKSGFNQEEAKIKEGDTLYTYDWMQPVAVAVSIGANVNQNMKEAATAEEALKGAAGSAYATFEGGANTLVEQSLLQGVRTALGGYPGQTVGDKITDILIDVPASFAPTIANQIRQTYDNEQRETYSPNKLEESFNKVKAKIPEAAKTLPQRFDTLGRPKETLQDNSLSNVFLNPGFQSKYKLSPEAKLVVDIIEETGDTSAAPRVPGKTLTITKNGETERVKLTGEQFSRLQKRTGELTQKELSKISPNIRTDARLKRISEALNKAGDKARDELRKEIRRAP